MTPYENALAHLQAVDLATIPVEELATIMVESILGPQGIVTVHAWGQRVEPKLGELIATNGREWFQYGDPTTNEYGVYLGNNLVKLLPAQPTNGPFFIQRGISTDPDSWENVDNVPYATVEQARLRLADAGKFPMDKSIRIVDSKGVKVL